MTKIEFVFMILTHVWGVINFAILVTYLAKKLHLTAVEKCVKDARTGIETDLNSVLQGTEKRLQGLEAFAKQLIKPSTSVVSPTASSTQASPQPSQPVVSPPAV
jgi:hypothetical protein